MTIVLQIILNGLIATAVLGLITAGMSFLHATTRIFHIAHGAIVLGAGYAFWWAWRVVEWPMALAVIFSVAVAAIAGLAMSTLVYEPLRQRGTRGIGYLIATLALLMLGTAIILLLFGAAPKTFHFQTPTLVWRGLSLTVLHVWTISIAALLITIFYWITKYTRFGKAMRATADNEEVARILGINTAIIRHASFMLVSLLAAPAGILAGLDLNLDPNMGILFAVRAFAATVIGGPGSIVGALVGSFIIGVGEQVAIWFLGQSWRHAVNFALLFLFLLAAPAGIFGRRRD